MPSEHFIIFDPSHSEITFKVKHLMITNVKGEFKSFEVFFNGDTATVKINVDSISTNNGDRDTHLKSADFFDSQNYPEIIFQTSSIKDGKINGNLTIKGVTQAVEFQYETAENKDPWGNSKIGYSVEGVIKRSDFGLTWNQPLETGGVLVSDEVKVAAELQFIKG